MHIPESEHGFTIVEIMIATTLFTAVVILGVGALLSSNATNRRTETARVAIDSMSFALEDMTRNLRLGTAYRCLGGSDPVTETPQDCTGGSQHIAFEKIGGTTGDASDQIVYSIRIPSGASTYSLMKSVDGGSNFIAVTPPEVEIDAPTSGFRVSGTASGGEQPFVVIRLSGYVRYQNASSPFALETSVSRRVIDIGS